MPLRSPVPITPATYFGLTDGRPADGKRWSTSWRALRNQSFRWYFIGSVTSDFGTWLQNTAQVLLAYRLSHSVLIVGIVTCAQFSSPLFLGPWAGVMTDKFGSRRILMATQFVAATFAGLMAALVFFGPMHVRWLGVGAIASGLAFTFALPARNVTVRRLVPEDDIEPAYAMDSVSYNLGRAVAPPLCIVLVMTSGFGWAFAANAVSFLVFAMCLILAGRSGAGPQPEPAKREKSKLKDGFVIACSDWRIAVLLLMVAAVTVADDPILVLGPAVAGHLHVADSWSGWFIAALGGGTILGSFLPPRHNPSVRLAATALAALAACMIFFVMSPSVWGSITAAAGAGVTCLIANSATKTVIAKRAGPDGEASVMAVWAIAWAGSKPVASLLDGLLAGHVGLQRTGVLLAAPALVPVSVMLVLMVPVLVLRMWQHPTVSWLASGRDKMESLEWFQCADTMLHASGETSMETAGRH